MIVKKLKCQQNVCLFLIMPFIGLSVWFDNVDGEVSSFAKVSIILKVRSHPSPYQKKKKILKKQEG